MRPLAAALGVAIVLWIAPACGAGGGVARDDFEAELVDRERITDDEAGCVGDYVYDAYTDGEIELLHESGINDLPSGRWAEYMHAMVACTMHDDLVASPS